MAKYINDEAADTLLNYIKTYCTQQIAKTGTQVDEDSISVATAVMDSGDYTGPEDGDITGRKLTVNEQADKTVDNAGTVTHSVLANTAGDNLYITTTESLALIDGGLVTFEEWVITIEDPT